MIRKSNQEKVYNALKEALKKDRSKTHVLPISEMGLIQMTRKTGSRTRLTSILCEPCIYCEGEGKPHIAPDDLLQHLPGGSPGRPRHERGRPLYPPRQSGNRRAVPRGGKTPSFCRWSGLSANRLSSIPTPSFISRNLMFSKCTTDRSAKGCRVAVSPLGENLAVDSQFRLCLYLSIRNAKNGRSVP